ncbi:MAG TPA: phosphoribosylanthranilate isomerase [Deltaproteobacteria bacterium]|nr:phosphoribosylanthranilate isomerase [Deltaproteobacteria bacterium]
MWVKICGITRYEDARTAAAFGADAIGFVLTRSRRQADPDELKEWVRELKGIEKVGVFTNEDPQDIIRVGTELGLDTVQIHGELGPGHKELIRRFSIIYAAKKIDERKIPEDLPCRILLDPSRGSGLRGSWHRSALPVILAGGLTPDNVKEAIIQAEPVGVDVSSGVESSPGIKDAALMERFIKEARS